jgi:hypothetical protein
MNAYDFSSFHEMAMEQFSRAAIGQSIISETVLGDRRRPVSPGCPQPDRINAISPHEKIELGAFGVAVRISSPVSDTIGTAAASSPSGLDTAAAPCRC